MRIAIYQGPTTTRSVQVQLQTMDTQANEASQLDNNLLMFPEMFISGYNIGRERLHELALTADSQTIIQAANIAKKHNIALLFGFPEYHDGNVFNSAILINRLGKTLYIYRKTHLFGQIDRESFAAGDQHCQIIEFNGIKMAILICYDIEFAENVRHLALNGADFVAVPTALMHPYEFVPNKLVPTRAFENQVFIAYANRCDVEGGLEYTGLSCIVGPDGHDLARAGTDAVLISANLDNHLKLKSRELNTYLVDRRPKMYKKLISPGDNQS